jgi:hypothetical protein
MRFVWNRLKNNAFTTCKMRLDVRRIYLIEPRVVQMGVKVKIQ